MQPVGLSLFHKYNETFRTPEPLPKPDLPIDLRTLYIENAVEKSDEDLDALCSEQFQKLSISQEQCNAVEEATRQQQKSSEWHTHRLGRITGSRVHAVMRTNIDNPAKSVIKMITRKEKPFSSVYTKYGIEKEPVALSDYSCIVKGKN